MLFKDQHDFEHFEHLNIESAINPLKEGKDGLGNIHKKAFLINKAFIYLFLKKTALKVPHLLKIQSIFRHEHRSP